MLINSWGRLSANPHAVNHLTWRNQSTEVISSATQPSLAFGMGRSYGDSCLNSGNQLWSTRGLNHFIAFDQKTGILTCEAGVLLKEIQQNFVPKGWMLPVTPGTQLVTVGGAIANDVHGKNHHVFGSFGDQVVSFKLARTTGEVITASKRDNPEWFKATIGGLGLTGVVLEASLQLRQVESSWLDTETIPYYSLKEFFHLANESESDFEHTVSWLDCIRGDEVKGVFLRANQAESNSNDLSASQSKLGLKMPFTPPVSFVNKITLKPFNSMYFYLQKRKAGRSRAHYEGFNYPLDNIADWNRMYGRKGFYQYQSVVPFENAYEATQAQIKAIKEAKQGSFLAVLKTFGNRNPLGLLSFPMPGVTLALDFPNLGETTLRLFEKLDAIVMGAGGRLYPAKDARMSQEMFQSGYSQIEQFSSYRDPGISSDMSRRLMGY